MILSAMLIASTGLALNPKIRVAAWVKVAMWIILTVEVTLFVWATFVQPVGMPNPGWEKIALFVLAGINVAIWVYVIVASSSTHSTDSP